MVYKSHTKIIQEPDLSFLFSDFFRYFSELGSSDSFGQVPVFEEEKVYDDYLQKGERLLTLAREKFKNVVGKIQLSDSEEKIFSSSFLESDSLYDIAGKIARIYTRPLLRAITQIDDAYAAKLIEAVSQPSLKISFESVDKDAEASYLRHIRRAFEKQKKTDAHIVKLYLLEDGFRPLIVYGALNHTHPASMKKIVYESGCCVADLGLLTAYLIIYKQLNKAFCGIKNFEDGYDSLATDFQERIQSYERQFIQCNITVWPKECEALLEHFSIEEIFSYPVHTVGIHKGYVPPCVPEFMDANGLTYIDHPTYDACHKVLWKISSPDNLQFRFNTGHVQLCFAYLLKTHIPFHSLLTQFERKDNIYWTPLPDSKSSHSDNQQESIGMQLLADLFRIIAFQKHSQKQMLSYYQDLEKTYAKSYMQKKTITKKAQKAMERSLFNDYFGFVEFDIDTDLNKAEEIAREFKAVKETYFPAIDSKANAIRFRKLGQHKALGLYYPSLACLCVDIHSPSSLIHEYGHLIDYGYGNLSDKADFIPVRKLYVAQLDEALESDELLQKKMKSGSKYNRTYYTMSTEIFARCFELYVSQCLMVRNSIVPATFPQAGIYSTSPEMLAAISHYFENQPFVKVQIAEQELKCADA